MSGRDAGGTLRLFFALWPNERMQAELAAAASKAILDAGGRAIPRANLHATLAFLGSVPRARFEDLGVIANEVAARWRSRADDSPLAPIVLRLDGTEHWRRAEILVAHASQVPQAATALARVLKESLIAGGFSPDLKPFHAHVTLARKVQRARDAAMSPVTWSFDSFALVSSQTAPSGSSYSVVRTWALDENSS
jgi:RNA 2',3'-cyclic 3'-phosphodiesterase